MRRLLILVSVALPLVSTGKSRSFWESLSYKPNIHFPCISRPQLYILVFPVFGLIQLHNSPWASSVCLLPQPTFTHFTTETIPVHTSFTIQFKKTCVSRCVLAFCSKRAANHRVVGAFCQDICLSSQTRWKSTYVCCREHHAPFSLFSQKNVLFDGLNKQSWPQVSQIRMRGKTPSLLNSCTAAADFMWKFLIMSK